jgi:hypothetical protein
MKKLKTKTKILLAVTAAICMGILITIPLYIHANNDWLQSPHSYACILAGGSANNPIVFAPIEENCHLYLFCDFNNYTATIRECFWGLLFCAEMQMCNWHDQPDCRYNCVRHKPVL